MQCSIKLIGAVTWPLRWNSPYPRPTTRFLPICLGEHFHVDFVLLGPIANNLDLDRCGNELPRLPLFENYLLIGLYILRWKGFADPLPHRQIRLVSKPDRVVSDVSRVAVANLRSRVGELARCLPLVPRTFLASCFRRAALLTNLKSRMLCIAPPHRMSAKCAYNSGAPAAQ